MTDFNQFLENLQNRVVQELPIELIYTKNIFASFDKGIQESFGSEDEFVADEPLENVK
jgi:hypothetical protein